MRNKNRNKKQKLRIRLQQFKTRNQHLLKRSRCHIFYVLMRITLILFNVFVRIMGQVQVKRITSMQSDQTAIQIVINGLIQLGRKNDGLCLYYSAIKIMPTLFLSLCTQAWPTFLPVLLDVPCAFYIRDDGGSFSCKHLCTRFGSFFNIDCALCFQTLCTIIIMECQLQFLVACTHPQSNKHQYDTKQTDNNFHHDLEQYINNFIFILTQITIKKIDKKPNIKNLQSRTNIFSSADEMWQISKNPTKKFKNISLYLNIFTNSKQCPIYIQKKTNIKEKADKMQRNIIVILMMVWWVGSKCVPDYNIDTLQTNVVEFRVQEEQALVEYSSQFYGYTLEHTYNSTPSTAVGIKSISVANVEMQKFMVKVQHASQTFINFVFLYKNSIWSSLTIYFIASTHPHIKVGSVISNFQSLKGDRGLTRISFNTSITNYSTSIGRVFLNGFSTNSIKTLQLGISQSRINQYQMMINVITGPTFDLKEIWFSFIIFSPNSLTFATYGRDYQEIHFKGTIYQDANGHIYYSDYRFVGLNLISFLNPSQPLDISAKLDDMFVFQLSSSTFVDKLSYTYIVMGRNTDELCDECPGTMPFLNQCREQCPVGSYRESYGKDVVACKQCSAKLNQQINGDSTGCECTPDAYKVSGKCTKRKVEVNDAPIESVEPTPIQSQPASIPKVPVPQQTTTPPSTQQKQQSSSSPTTKETTGDCSKIKNSYWTGYRCACKTGFIPLSGGCQSFVQYVKSLSYSSTLYPTQFQYMPSNNKVAENPCKIEELRVNGQCVCKDNFYRNGQGLCVECQPHSTYNAATKICECNKGYRMDADGTCVVSCPQNMRLNLDGECVCPPGQAILNNYCIPCNKDYGGYIINNRCFYCPGDLRFNGERCACGRNQVKVGTKCQSCSAFQTPYNNKCQCFEPFRRNSITKKCQVACTDSQVSVYGRCINCPKNSHNNGNNICLCDEGFKFQGSVCVRDSVMNCPMGTYNLNNNCNMCPSGCTGCLSASVCISCGGGYRLVGGKCYETCGDGMMVGKETCDDGNSHSYDGCSSSCSQEAGYQCYGRPSVCRSVCGNSIITRYQRCDDGNRIDGDGCSSNCQNEPGFYCGGQPSRCWKF